MVLAYGKVVQKIECSEIDKYSVGIGLKKCPEGLNLILVEDNNGSNFIKKLFNRIRNKNKLFPIWVDDTIFNKYKVKDIVNINVKNYMIESGHYLYDNDEKVKI